MVSGAVNVFPEKTKGVLLRVIVTGAVALLLTKLTPPLFVVTWTAALK